MITNSPPVHDTISVGSRGVVRTKIGTRTATAMGVMTRRPTTREGLPFGPQNKLYAVPLGRDLVIRTPDLVIRE